MYLGLLKDKEKQLFLDLVYDISIADEDFGEEEKILIESYCKEMDIENETISKSMPAEKIIQEFYEISNIQTKKIVVFEAIGLAIADGIFDGREKDIINSMIEKFGLDSSYMDQCEKLLNQYLDLQDEINDLVII